MADDSDSLADLVREISRELRRRTVAIAEPHGLTAHQFRALRMVDRSAGERSGLPLRISEIADRLRIVARSATDVIDDLERKGLVRRSPHPTDRRSVVVELTRHGRDVLEEVDRSRRADARQFFSRLSATERRDLAALLRRLEG